ncbi:polymorphic toxin-type HINT domain-containing protein [Paenibacillus ehimensis]|uniref:polymorphic toxin-type HINT domain-containing protein n=1 Tax=Paenibacillus ehimensis TaxID=79264 RepID=UPI000472A8AB|nr:polymorphic toxin-type HINT domain-containing protein [Paenibacillus ehimensis]
MKRVISLFLSLLLFLSLITPIYAEGRDMLGFLSNLKTGTNESVVLDQTPATNKIDDSFQEKTRSNISTFNANVTATDSVYGSVYNSVYRAKLMNPPKIVEPVNLKPNDAPYQINSEYDAVSTISGDLSVRTTDMTIRGKNGLSFPLTRQYSAAESAMYDVFGDSLNPREAPIGVGWSWDFPQLRDGNLVLSDRLGNGTYPTGSFLPENSYSYIKGYPWKDITLEKGFPDEFVDPWRVTNLEGLTYYFEHRDGLLVKIEDKYNNQIKFNYTFLPGLVVPVLESISTEGETIKFQYDSSGVTITKGDQTVRYILTTYIEPTNQREVKFLSKVVDAEGRVTTYDYTEKPAYHNRNVNARHMLLTKVDHPTGASSLYTYEDQPTFRCSFTPFTQVYRIKEKALQVKQTDGSLQTFKKERFGYEGDLGNSCLGDFSYYVYHDDGLTQTKYTNKKQNKKLEWEETPPFFYQTNITKTSIRNGVAYTISTDQQYDEARHLPYPNKVTTTYTAQGQSFSKSASREFDVYGNMLWSTNPMGITTNYDYDPNTHLLSSITQPIYNNQKRYTLLERNDKYKVTKEKVFENDPNGKLLSETRYEDIDAYGNPRKIITKTDDAKENETLVEYGPQYHSRFPTKTITDVTNVDGATLKITQQYYYNPTLGKVTTIIDGKGYATNYDYDKLGRVTKATNPDKSVVTLQYDDGKNSILITDEEGVKTYTQWNPIGWKIATGVSEQDIRSKFGYDSYGRLEWSEDARGNRTWFGYDQWSRQNKITYPDSSVATVEYNDIQRMKVSTDAEGYKITETLDPLDRTIKKEETKLVNGQPVVQILGTLIYDAADKVRESIDGRDNRTKFDYDALGRLTGVTNAKNEFTKYEYTSKDRLNLLKIVFPDKTERSKKYDELGRTIQTIAPDQAVEKFYFDENNNLRTYVDRKGQVTTNDYDNRNKLLSSALGNETIKYGYYATGKRKFMQDNTGTTNYHYNELGQLDILTYPDGRTIQYLYDRQGNRETMTDPFGYVTAYGYDNRNRLTGVGPSINDWDAKYDYKHNDLLATIVHRNGVTGSYAYEGLNLTGLSQQKQGAALNTFAYGYDSNRNQTSKTENGTRHEFSYDPLNRIGTSSQFGEQYTYDSRGNRQTMQSSNTPNLNGASYRYDERNRLVQVTTDDGKNVAYRYNGDGLLYERTENGQTVRYYYDGANIIAEGTVMNGSAALKARYILGNGLAARADASDTKTYYLHNGHGDVVGLTDGSGNILNQYTYDIWGNPLTVTEQVPQPFRYSGEFWDNSAHLQYLRARWYDPSVGRFMSQDTYEGDIANPLSLNLYTYVKNNPLRYLDPSGHDPRELQALLEMARDGEVSRTQVHSQFGGYYQRIFQDDNNNYYNYLFEKATMTSSYGNSLGDSDWAIGVLVNVNIAANASAADLANLLESFVETGAISLRKGAQSARTKASANISAECNCFTAGTKVLTDEGEKPIEDIEVGDKVLSKDDETGEVAYKEVTATFNHETDEIYKIHVGNQVIESTFNHPFWVEGKGWTFVKDLMVGDLLVRSDGNTLKIESIELEHKQVTVYNMTVDKFHTYFVSDLGIWVHNTNCSWKTIVESKNATRTIDSLPREQKAAFDKAIQGLSSGNTSGLNVHRLSDGSWAADVKGIGKGRGQGRIIYTEKDGVITIDEVSTKHYSK